MFRRLFFILTAVFLLGNAVNVYAQKLYLIAEGDINDPKIGQAGIVDINNVRSFFSDHLPSYRLVIYNQSNEWRGPAISDTRNYSDPSEVKNAIMTAIRNCPAGPSDRIVFYWTGHGAYDENNNRQHFLMLPRIMGKTSAIYRSEILNAMKRKGAILTVLITDSCNVPYNFPDSRPQSPFPPDDDIVPIFRSLFFRCKGVVDINSASYGEKARCRPELGGLFTHHFLIVLFNNLYNSMSWSEVLNATDASVRTSGYYGQHIYKWSLPTPLTGTVNNPVPSRPTETVNEPIPDNYSAPRYHPDNGDRIISVNNISIQDTDHFSQVIYNANTRVRLTLIDYKTGKRYFMITDLNPRGSDSRLGIYVVDDSRGGVRVTGVMSGYPGDRCRYMYDNNDNSGGGNNAQWSDARFHPEAGDRIIYVNDIKIQNINHFSQVIYNANTRVQLTLIDYKTGKRYYMMTDLNPRGSVSRLGIYVEDDSREGVRVTRIMPDSPGTRCRYLMDGNVQSVKSDDDVY